MKRILLAGVVLLAACRHKAYAPSISEVAVANPAHQSRILRGVYPGGAEWRWTAPTFAFRADPPAGSAPVYVEMDFTVPEELARGGQVRVTSRVNGIEAAHDTYRVAGRYTLAGKVAGPLLQQPADIEFTADRSFKDDATGREQSLIVVSAGLKPYEQTAAFRDAEMAKARAAYAEILKQRNLKVPAEKQREIMKIFHDLPIWDHMWYHDVPIIKNPLDLWMLQQIAYEIRPDFIVETGTWQGGSALWWANTLEGMGLEKTRVLTVDIQNLVSPAAKAHPQWNKHVEFFLGSSTDPKIVAELAKRVKGARVLVNLDSDHSMAHVFRELTLYAPMASPGSYVAVEDSHLDGIPTHPEQGPGPAAAIRKYLADGGDKLFEQDFTREAFVMTSYPGGWLKRK